MQTERAIQSPQMLPPPVVLLKRLLLAEFCSADSLPAWSSLAPDVLKIRAAKASALLENLLAHAGYRHGGIND